MEILFYYLSDINIQNGKNGYKGEPAPKTYEICY